MDVWPIYHPAHNTIQKVKCIALSVDCSLNELAKGLRCKLISCSTRTPLIGYSHEHIGRKFDLLNDMTQFR